MNKIKFSICVLFSLVFFSSCQNSVSKDSDNQIESKKSSEEIVQEFFTDFQNANDGWTKSTVGHNNLKKAFEEKMTTDIEFAKAVASYNVDSYRNPIRMKESITSYNRGDGEEGEIKAFEFVIPVFLIKPLYNGQKEIQVSYEIISTIPSTIENHKKPYTDNVNYCATFAPYFKTNRDGVLNLGSFIVTKNDN